MQTTFICGIYTASFNEPKGLWVITNDLATIIAVVDENGEMIRHLHAPTILVDNLIVLVVLMNNIKRQYKQLQST